jgi:hypothetical protein
VSKNGDSVSPSGNVALLRHYVVNRNDKRFVDAELDPAEEVFIC